MASSEENKAAVRDFFGCASSGDFDVLDVVVDPDYVLHDPAMPEDVRGIDGVKQVVESYRSGIAGLNVTIEQQLAEGDLVATRYTCRGRHEGDLMGAAGTGRDVEIAGLLISRCRDGKVVEEWAVSDVFGLLQQIGALPEMAAS